MRPYSISPLPYPLSKLRGEMNIARCKRKQRSNQNPRKHLQERNIAAKLSILDVGRDPGYASGK